MSMICTGIVNIPRLTEVNQAQVPSMTSYISILGGAYFIYSEVNCCAELECCIHLPFIFHTCRNKVIEVIIYPEIKDHL